MTAGASAFYVFVNALFYWITKLQLGGFVGGVLYIGYSLLISFLFFILTGKEPSILCSTMFGYIDHLIGSIGFLASWAFVQKIYGSIKID